MPRILTTPLLAAVLALLSAAPATAADILYATDFETTAVGDLAIHPGDPAQDGWYTMLAGEATAAILATGGDPDRCLDLTAPASNPEGVQTYAIRDLEDLPLWRAPLLTLAFDVRCSTSDQTSVNRYFAQVTVVDPDTPFGFAAAAALVAGESGQPRDVTGLDLVVPGYVEGIGNLPLPLTVGQDLAWDVWHRVEVTLSPATGRYVSVTVDGSTQDLSDHLGPRFLDGGVWRPAVTAGVLETQVVSHAWEGVQTDDAVRLDDVSITTEFLPEPTLVSVDDVPEDQGGRVRLTWLRSRYDGPEAPTVLSYDVYRRHPDAKLEGWDYVMSVPAAGDAVDHVIAPTLADSTDQGVRWSVFLLRAMTDDPLTYFQSAPDSGWSADNLAPSTPESFSVAYGPDGVDLAWSECGDPDFRFFRIYRGTGAKSEEPVHETVALAWHDPDGDWSHAYRLAVVDLAGNESFAAPPTEATGLAGLPSAPILHAPAPNPFNAAVTLAFEVPHADRPVRLTIHDAAGRRVRTLVDGPCPTGLQRRVWRGRDDRGRALPSGVYVARLSCGNIERQAKLTLLE